MVDQSHNLKNKVEAMIQTVMTAQQLYAKAALIDHQALETARIEQRIIDAENLLKDAFETDVRPILREWRESRGLPRDPLLAFRESRYTERVARERGGRKKSAVSYA
jgi:L-rhamnose isomerase/sugar isomerase